jgi:hypothetical protein
MTKVPKLRNFPFRFELGSVQVRSGDHEKPENFSIFQYVENWGKARIKP